MSMYRRRLLMYQALMNKSGNIVYPGLIAAWSAKGKTNDDEDRATLKDLTGNGHDITLNGFAFSEMSGYEGYGTNLNRWRDSWNTTSERTKYKVLITKATTISNKVWNIADYTVNSVAPAIFKGKLKFKITGLEFNKVLLNIRSSETDTILLVNKDGEYSYSYDFTSQTNYDAIQWCFYTEDGVSKTISNIEIELLPEYPNALVFDGVNDYGFNNNMPIISDYTLIVEREILDDFTTRGMVACYIGNTNRDKGPFWLEYGFNPTNISTYSFGKPLVINDVFNKNRFISYQTKLSYNGKDIPLNDSLISGNKIVIGGFYNYRSIDINMAFYSAYLFDRSLDEQEIKSFIRKYIDPEYLLPSEIPTPDCYYDLSQGSNDDGTRETIKDYSGNGKDAKAYNFDWSDMSGYGGYATDFTKWYKNIGGTYNIINKNIVHITKCTRVGGSILNCSWNILNNKKTIFKISGLIDGQSISFGSDNNPRVEDIEINSNGIHEIQWDKQGIIYAPCILAGFVGECNITIELLPEYEGALVFDGVDDCVILSNSEGYKTIIFVYEILNGGLFIYDQRSGEIYAIRNELDMPAYYNRSNSNPVYINGILNSIVTAREVLNKKICVCISSSSYTKSNGNPKISSQVGINNSHFVKMAVYKFLGFKEALTEDQIQYVIKKYNLLDGVDEIEVN